MTAHDDPDRTEILITRLSGVPSGDGETLAPGARMGRYRIESLLGRGGMGEVYRAEQLEPVRRTVAIKLLRVRQVEARHLAYFEIERQLLAQMRHPAIAQIYDAGATAEGFPFFAMEYIEGSPVTRFCQQQRVPLRERLELFIRICEGVQHAHHKGVIHRDLKPGNILVDRIDGRPLPKIIDFGIATAASRATGDATLERAGTPEYMSPEQARGEQAEVDTRSDIHALGVILHELLVGQRPQRDGDDIGLHGSRLLERQEAQQQREFAQALGMRAPALRRVLRDELDWALAKALQPSRDERYASAAELADDVRRFLHDQPLRAVPPRRGYVWGKFVRRHRGALLAASAMLCALLGGLGLSLYGLQQARSQRAVAEQRSGELKKVVDFQQSMLESMDMQVLGARMAENLGAQVGAAIPERRGDFDALLARADTTDTARELVDYGLLSGAENAIAQEFADDPQLASELRESVARVQAALGLSGKAARAFAQVADYRERTSGAAAPQTLRARNAQVQALIAAADFDAAQEVLRRTLPQAGALAGDDADRVGLELAQAEIVAARGDRPQAKAMRERLLEQLTARYGDRSPAAMDALNAVIASQRSLGELGQALANGERLLAMRTEALGADHEKTLTAQGNLAILRIMNGEKESAVQLQQALTERIVARQGNEHPESLRARATLGTMLIENRRFDEAIPQLQSVLEARERVIGKEHPETVRTRLNLATAYARSGDALAALPLEEQVIEVRTRRQGPQHPDTVSMLINHAGTLHRAGRNEEALRLLHDAAPLARQVLGEKHPQLQSALLIRADALMDLHRGDAAIASYLELYDLRERVLGAQHPETLVAAWNLVQAYGDLGRPDLAASWRRRHLEPLLATDPATLSEPLRALAGKIREGDRAPR